MTEDNQKANATIEIGSARDALRVAQAALDMGILRDAMSRIYYAAFHAARAILVLHGVEPKTHAGLVHLFNDRVIRAGQLDRRFNLLLTRLQAYRAASDYAYSFEMNPEDVAAELAAATELVDRAAAIVAAG